MSQDTQTAAGPASPASIDDRLAQSLGAFKVSKIEKQWANHGLYAARLVFHNPQAGFYESNFKAILQEREGTFSPRAIVGSTYTLLPNEEVRRILADMAGEYELKIGSPRYSKDGNAMWIDATSPKLERDTSGKAQIGDITQYGVSIRNSIDGSMGFNAEGFGMRVWCANGAAMRVNAGKSIVYSHKAGLAAIIPMLKQKLEAIFADVENMAARARYIRSLEVTQRMAEELSRDKGVNPIPATYLPWGFEEIRPKTETQPALYAPDLKTIEEKTNDAWSQHVRGEMSPRNLFAVYNHISGGITHNEKLDERSRRQYFEALEDGMDRALATVEVRA